MPSAVCLSVVVIALCALLAEAQLPKDFELDEIRVAAPASFAFTLMGFSVRVDKSTENRMIVGSRTTQIGKPAAFIYTRNAGRLDWSLEAILEPPAATDSDQDSFGQIVAIEGDLAAVSSPHAAAGGGAVYIYKLSSSSSSWTLTDTLYSRNGSSRFGSDLSIFNKKLLVAAGRPFTKAASIDYFLYDLMSLASPPIGLAPLAPITFAHYSRAAALSSTHAFIAYPSSVDGASSYLFIYLLADLSQTQVIVSPIVSSFSRLSASTTSGLLAAADDNHRNVYVFSLSATSSQWAQEVVFPSPVDRPAVFGAALAIEDDRLIVGAPVAAGLEDSTGCALLYQRYATGWSAPIKIGSTRGKPHDNYGYSVAIAAHTAFVGVFGATCPPPLCKEFTTGSVHVYNQSNSCKANPLAYATVCDVSETTLYYFTNAIISTPTEVPVPIVVVGNLSVEAPVTISSPHIPVTTTGCLDIGVVPVTVTLGDVPANASLPLARTDCVSGEFSDVNIRNRGCKRFASLGQVYDPASSTLSVTLSIDSRDCSNRKAKIIGGVIGGVICVALIIGGVIYLGHVKRVFRGLDVLYRANEDTDGNYSSI